MKRRLPAIAAIIFTLGAHAAQAADVPRFGVLDFELNDLTLKPRTPEELDRTASLAPLLRNALHENYHFDVTPIPADAREKADAGFGYLYNHPDAAAELGQRYGVEWLVVGRLHKPSFLFAYLQVRLVNVAQKRVVRDSLVEVKGNLSRLNQVGLAQVAQQFAEVVQNSVADHQVQDAQ